MLFTVHFHGGPCDDLRLLLYDPPAVLDAGQIGMSYYGKLTFLDTWPRSAPEKNTAWWPYHRHRREYRLNTQGYKLWTYHYDYAGNPKHQREEPNDS